MKQGTEDNRGGPYGAITMLAPRSMVLPGNGDTAQNGTKSGVGVGVGTLRLVGTRVPLPHLFHWLTSQPRPRSFAQC